MHLRATRHLIVGSGWSTAVLLLGHAVAGSGCTSSRYQGSTAAPTAHVEVFHAEREVVRPHLVMGTITTRAPAFMTEASIEMELVNQAQRRGADAIIVDSITLETVGYRTTDPAGDAETYSGAGSSPGGTPTGDGRVPIQEKAASARLLRYTG